MKQPGPFKVTSLHGNTLTWTSAYKTLASAMRQARKPEVPVVIWERGAVPFKPEVALGLNGEVKR